MSAEQILRAVCERLPEYVSVSVVPIGQGCLLPAEAAALGRAVPARRAEFAAGRLALRQAISATGYELNADRPILVRKDRRPDVPPGISVSLSHSAGYCIALATRALNICLGVDIEARDALRPDDLAQAVKPYRMSGFSGDPLLAFSAKEALFKRQFAVTGRMLDFDDISLVLRANGRFAGCLAGVGLLHGTWNTVGAYIIALSIGSVIRP